MSGLKSRRCDVWSESNNAATNRMSDGDLIFLWSVVPVTLHHSTIDLRHSETWILQSEEGTTVNEYNMKENVNSRKSKLMNVKYTN